MIYNFKGKRFHRSSSYIAQHCPFETISSTFAKRRGTKTRIQDDHDKWNSWRGPATKRNKFLRHQVTSNVTNDVRRKRSRCLFNCDDPPSIFHWIPLLNLRKYTISAFTNICLSTQILSTQNISHSSWQLLLIVLTMKLLHDPCIAHYLLFRLVVVYIFFYTLKR